MRFNWNPIKGCFVRRINRFVGLAEVEGEVCKVHIHDPGRLEELLVPGAEILVRAHEGESRRTKYYLFAVKYCGSWILLDSAVHNRIAREAIEHGMIGELNGYRVLKAEHYYMGCRVDFLLESPLGIKALMEVKGCSLAVNGVALFPDAPTIRGRRHVERLIRALNEGYESIILFLVLRSDAAVFKPNWSIDPNFSAILVRACEVGVKVLAYKVLFRVNGEVEARISSSIPVVLH